MYCLIGKKWYHYSIFFFLSKFLRRPLQFFLQVLFNSHYVPAFGHHVYHFFASEFKMDLHFFGYVHLFFKVRSYSAPSYLKVHQLLQSCEQLFLVCTLYLLVHILGLEIEKSSVSQILEELSHLQLYVTDKNELF